MANIYDMAGAIQQPNAIGNFNQGVQIGQQNQVYAQKQAAYQQALSDQQNIRALAPQVIAGDPGAFSQVAAIDPSQAQNLQNAGDAQLRRLSGAIQYIDSQKDPQAKEAAYQQSVKPYLAQLGQATGKVPPATFAEAEPMMEAARAKIASFSASQPSDLATIGAGGAVYDKTHQRVLYQNPGVPRPATMVTIHTPNGDQQAMLNPDGTLSALKIGGQTGASPQVNTQLTPNPNAQSVAADQATALVSTGMDPGQAAAMAMAQHPGTTLAFDAGSKSFRDVSNGSEMIPPTAGVAPDVALGAQAAIPPNGQATTQIAPIPAGGIPGNQSAPVPPQTPNVAVAPQGQPGTQATPGAPSPLALPGGLGMSPPKGANSVIDQRLQQVKDLAKNGVTMTPEQRQQYLTTGKVGESFQGNTDVKPFGDETKTGVDYLGSLSGGNADIVKGLLNGTVQLPTGTALKNGFWQSALASVKHADPTWNQAAYKQFADTRKYMTIGQGGKLINSINTGAQHLQKLVDDINALNNSGSTDYNALANNLSGRFGGQAVTNFMGDVTPVASELASIYKNGGTPTDQETQHWREALSPDMSRGQQLNVVRGWIDLLAGKLNATRDQYRASMSPLAEPLNVINPKAEEALQKITQLGNSLSTTGQHETPAIDQTSINAPGQQPKQATSQAQPRAVNSMGHAVVWNGSAWVPE